MRLLLLPSVCCLLGSACAQDGAEKPELPAGPPVVWQEAFPAQPGFERPLFVAFTATDPDMAYVVVQPGQVFRIPRDGTKADRSTFLDLGAKVFRDHDEEGLLGFAFDPGYADNGHVWVYWTESIPVRKETMPDGSEHRSNRQQVISRFATQAAGGGARVVDPASELRVLEVFHPFGNHNGGTIVFGPDRMLYVASGDGGAANDPFGAGQRKNTLLGKVLRIDVSNATKEKPYVVPPDNPFVGEAGARGEIWCYGLRNPWRIAFDRQTGDLWCGDVGQNRIEEVDRLVKGGNYGWNPMEASQPFDLRKDKTPAPPDVIAPIAEYPHSQGLSVTGGHVYRGTKIQALQGFYVYGDYATLRMWAVKEDRAGGKHEVVTLAKAPMQPSSFAEEPDGEILMTGFSGRNGRIFRLAQKPAK